MENDVQKVLSSIQNSVQGLCDLISMLPPTAERTFAEINLTQAKWWAQSCGINYIASKTEEEAKKNQEKPKENEDKESVVMD